MKKHKISWTEATWNPYIGCDKVSEGCRLCYAIGMSYRLAHIPAMKDLYSQVVEKTKGGKLNWTGKIVKNVPQFDKPLRTKKPTIFFVNSMSDLFHEGLTFEEIDMVYDVMYACQQHTFQVLTKRPERALAFYKWKEEGNGFKPKDNVWVGVSVENQKHADERIPLLLKIPAAVRFLSCEPLLGPVNLESINGPAGSRYQVLKPIANSGDSNRPAISWVIAGGESGPDSRPMNPQWVSSLRDQCKRNNIPFLFKQWGSWMPIGQLGLCAEDDKLNKNEVHVGDEKAGSVIYKMRNVGKAKSGNVLDGVQHMEMPNR